MGIGAMGIGAMGIGATRIAMQCTALLEIYRRGRRAGAGSQGK